MPQTGLPMPKLDHAASLISSDAASTRKATLQRRTTNRKSINTGYNVLFLRRKVTSQGLTIGKSCWLAQEHLRRQRRDRPHSRVSHQQPCSGSFASLLLNSL